MLVDTHCHLHFDAFQPDRAEVIKRARAAGVQTLINVGTEPGDNPAAFRLAQENEGLFHTAGFHPHHAHEATDAGLEEFKIFVERTKPVAIGEIGMDFFKSEASAQTQEKVFSFMLELAASKRLPAIVHSRNAFDETFELVSRSAAGGLRGVMHCFSYGKEALRKLLDVGFYASFTCNLTFKNAGALLETAAWAPLDRILLETDSPYLAPQSVRGKRNEPAHLAELARLLAEKKNVSIEKIESCTTANAQALFKLP